jgi:antitoxin ParD1/3/4
MATLTISLPDDVKDWLDEQVEGGDYASAGEYLSDLIERDRTGREADHDERLAELRRIVDESIASGVSTRATAEIFAEAEEVARRRGTWRE